jgi:hypothetical protein
MLTVLLSDASRITYERLSQEPNGHFMRLHESDYQAIKKHMEDEIVERLSLLKRMDEARKLHKLVVPYHPQRKAA